MTSAKAPARHAYLVIGTIALVASLGLTLIDIAVRYIESVLELGPPAQADFRALFWTDAPFWLTVAALAPAVVLLSKRLSLDSAGKYWGWLIHLLAATCFSAAVLLISRPFFAARQHEPFWSPHLVRATAHYSSTLFATYWFIVAGFYVYRYYHASQASELQAALLRESLATEQLRALRAQLNPHFLFNTLQSVSALAMRKDHDAVVETVGRLGQLLRSALDEREQEVALQTEASFAQDYLELEHLRFSDRLAFAINVAPEASSALVPSMILQPLVENAVVHAVAPSARPVQVLVDAHRLGNKLRLKVEDDGPGFKPAPTRRGVGLQNTRSRLEQLYGAESLFEITPVSPQGTAVMIEIPFRTTSLRSSANL